MRQVVRGRTIDELDKAVLQKERSGWKRLTDNKIDDSMGAYGVITWVCVMELEESEKYKHKEKKWGFMNPY